MLSESYGRGYLFCTELGYVPIFFDLPGNKLCYPVQQRVQTRAYPRSNAPARPFNLLLTLLTVHYKKYLPGLRLPFQVLGSLPWTQHCHRAAVGLWPHYRFVTVLKNALRPTLPVQPFFRRNDKILARSGPSQAPLSSPETRQEPSPSGPALKCVFGKKKRRRVQLEVEQIYRTRA